MSGVVPRPAPPGRPGHPGGQPRVVQQTRAPAGRSTVCLAGDGGEEPTVECRPREGTDDGRPDVVNELDWTATSSPGTIEQDRFDAIVQGDRGLHVEHDGAIHASRVSHSAARPAPGTDVRNVHPRHPQSTTRSEGSLSIRCRGGARRSGGSAVGRSSPRWSLSPLPPAVAPDRVGQQIARQGVLGPPPGRKGDLVLRDGDAGDLVPEWTVGSHRHDGSEPHRGWRRRPPRLPRSPIASVDVVFSTVTRIFLAGASRAIGRPLTAMLVAAGHEVTGTTRTHPTLRTGSVPRARDRSSSTCSTRRLSRSRSWPVERRS